MTAIEDLAPVLAEIDALLRRNGCHREAEVVVFAARLWARNPIAARDEMNGDDWWHGHHGIAAIDLAIAGGFTRVARDDAQRLRDALIELREHLDAHGLNNDEADLQVRQFRKWAASHV
ncbi:MAG: hypothetical protein H6981_11280 [Gammaproteobacteria bacterium]|nr:hypothetical protein [Gammaproteobacteria bacterium]